MWLDPIPPALRANAAAALDHGDAIGFLTCGRNAHGLELVHFNISELKANGIYEEALIYAFTAPCVNNHRWPLSALRHLFEAADRVRLRSAGDPLPGRGPFTLYRGVAGRGTTRRVRGLSWTADLHRARWFAQRFCKPDPAVFRVVVAEADVLAYCNDRNEREFLVMLPSTAQPMRICEPSPVATSSCRT